MPSYYGDLPNVGACLVNQQSEEDQGTSFSDISLFVGSEEKLQAADTDEQFWADNELDSESSCLLQQKFQESISVLRIQSSHNPEKQHATNLVTPSAHQTNYESSGNKPIFTSTCTPVLTAKVPSSSAKTLSGGRTPKLKRKLQKQSLTSSSSSGESNFSIDISKQSELKNDGTPPLCCSCKIHLRDGVIIHGNIGHQCCCYHCALKLWRTKGNCPMCHQKIKKIIKAVSPKFEQQL